MRENLSIKDKERIISIDVMRGIAIFGIFLVNIFSFHTPYAYVVDPMILAENNLDKFAYGFVDVFAQASFYPLFAFLFGYGLFILKERVEFRNQALYKIATRRMIFLLFIGFLHAFLIWSGDILITYGALGLILLLLINLSSKVLTITAISLYTIFSLIYILILFLASLDIPLEALNSPADAAIMAEVYQNGSFIEITARRIYDWKNTNVAGGLRPVFILATVLPHLMLGASFAKNKRLLPSAENSHFFRRLLLFTLPIGLLLKFSPYFLEKNAAILYIQDLYGGVTLTFAYISMIYLFCNKIKLGLFLQSLANVGKMSLSNYLFQSLLCSLIFYGYGLGLFENVTYWQSTLMVIIIYLFQLIFSSFWMKRFRMGPFEWLLRGVSYWKFSKLGRREMG